ncbi:MAG: PorV/PorQ family protein [Elusimicrobiales bacterium]|nr:PorV/PorQ family protein [Elusimicrobiales bacterium]
MKNIIKIFSLILLAAAAAQAGQTGAQFLKIDTDARLSGMASAGAAAVYGIGALNYNPAGLASLEGPEAAFSHSKWLMDASHDFAGFGLKAGSVKGEKLAMGVGVTRLSNTSFDGRGEDRSLSGGYSAYDQVVSVGLAVKNIGCAVKYIQSSIAGVRAETFAVDLGARQKLSRVPVTLGLGVQNLGRGLKYLSQRDQLPLSVNAGVSVMAIPGMGLNLDVKRLVYDKETILSVGTEYAMLVTNSGVGFALRGGYGLAGLAPKDGKSGLSVGAGLMALGAQVDYAMSPETGLGSVQRITLKKKF